MTNSQNTNLSKSNTIAQYPDTEKTQNKYCLISQ